MKVYIVLSTAEYENDQIDSVHSTEQKAKTRCFQLENEKLLNNPKYKWRDGFIYHTFEVDKVP